MDHIAFMQKSWGLTEKIVTGQKIIESRWFNVKYAPWERISAGDTIYFKNVGEPVTIQAEVEKVLYVSDLTPKRCKQSSHNTAKTSALKSLTLQSFSRCSSTKGIAY